MKLSDFYLSIPIKDRPGDDSVLRWTVFHQHQSPSDDSCQQLCRLKLDCSTSFVGQHGCFLANRDHLRTEEEAEWQPAAAGNRSFAAVLDGCANSKDASMSGGSVMSRCSAVRAEKGYLYFAGVKPVWQSATAQLSLTVTEDVGEQRFRADSKEIILWHGRPVPSSIVVQPFATGPGNTTQPVQVRGSVGDGGNLVVEVQEFDPTQTDSMQLLLLPVLPDLATGP